MSTREADLLHLPGCLLDCVLWVYLALGVIYFHTSPHRDFPTCLRASSIILEDDPARLNPTSLCPILYSYLLPSKRLSGA